MCDSTRVDQPIQASQAAQTANCGHFTNENTKPAQAPERYRGYTVPSQDEIERRANNGESFLIQDEPFEGSFAVLKNEMWDNRSVYRVSTTAIGAWAEIASKPPWWQFSQAGMIKTMTVGRDAARKMFDELEAHGWLLRLRPRGTNGKLESGAIWVTLRNPRRYYTILDYYLSRGFVKSNKLCPPREGSAPEWHDLQNPSSQPMCGKPDLGSDLGIVENSHAVEINDQENDENAAFLTCDSTQNPSSQPMCGKPDLGSDLGEQHVSAGQNLCTENPTQYNNLNIYKELTTTGSAEGNPLADDRLRAASADASAVNAPDGAVGGARAPRSNPQDEKKEEDARNDVIAEEFAKLEARSMRRSKNADVLAAALAQYRKLVEEGNTPHQISVAYSRYQAWVMKNNVKHVMGLKAWLENENGFRLNALGDGSARPTGEKSSAAPKGASLSAEGDLDDAEYRKRSQAVSMIDDDAEYRVEYAEQSNDDHLRRLAALIRSEKPVTLGNGLVDDRLGKRPSYLILWSRTNKKEHHRDYVLWCYERLRTEGKVR